MPKTLTFTGTLTITHCGVCQIPHAIPTEMYDDRLAGTARMDTSCTSSRPAPTNWSGRPRPRSVS